jgi:hypothetical protein
MGRHPIPITYSQKPKKNPKMGRDPMISALSYDPPSTSCRSPKIGQYDQESPKTWSRANRPPTLTCDSSQVTRI